MREVLLAHIFLVEVKVFWYVVGFKTTYFRCTYSHIVKHVLNFNVPSLFILYFNNLGLF